MGFFLGGGVLLVCLCVRFTVRALICISNRIFVQTGEDSVDCADSKSIQHSPAMYDLA